MSRAPDKRLARLDEAKRWRPGARRTLDLLRSLGKAEFGDAESLIRLHDALLFLRAYPQSRDVLVLAEQILSTFAERVARLQKAGADLSAFDHPEVSGIAGTPVTTDFSYDVVRWLKRHFGKRVRIDWSLHDAPDRLRAAWPPFLPLLEEEALEDANVAYRTYLRKAKRRGEDDLGWLLARVEALPLPPREKAEAYDAQGLSLRWELGEGRATRTRMRHPSGRIFFHDEPLLGRRDVLLQDELTSPPLPVRRLSPREGKAILERTREATAIRYREYYGFTYGDPSTVLAARAGRGVEIFLFGLEASRRLPLRAGYAAFLVKNGVPVGYVEGLAFFERIEVGFNIYYAFREGESAWIFGRVVKLLHQVLGVTSFSMDPYQIGHENEEAIASGAFWFYRKLGFRSTDPKLRGATDDEERKLAADPAYRTPARVLRRLATSNLLYDAPGAESDWDRFHIRNLSLAVLARMRELGGDAARIRRLSESKVSRALGVDLGRFSPGQRRAFADLSLVLDLIPDLPRWSRKEKRDAAEAVRAKAGRSENRFLRLLRRHARLRAAILKLGSPLRDQ